jgi:hypothetical protein
MTILKEFCTFVASALVLIGGALTGIFIGSVIGSAVGSVIGYACLALIQVLV